MEAYAPIVSQSKFILGLAQLSMILLLLFTLTANTSLFSRQHFVSGDPPQGYPSPYSLLQLFNCLQVNG